MVDEVSHAQSFTNYSSVFCSAKSTLSHLRVRAPRGLRVHRTLIQYPRFRFATHKGRLCVTEPAGETSEAKASLGVIKQGSPPSHRFAELPRRASRSEQPSPLGKGDHEVVDEVKSLPCVKGGGPLVVEGLLYLIHRYNANPRCANEIRQVG